MKMSDVNKVILSGRIGNDLELKTSANGKEYLRLSIAVHSFRRLDDESGEQSTNVKTTCWHRIVVFGVQAHNCSTFLRKGSPVLVEGELQNSSYVDKKGEKQYSSSIVANRVHFLAGRMSAEARPDDGLGDVSALMAQTA